jgi:uncharacterized membrane protein/thiol-disulfide isomerase/thioredoxin
MKTIYWLGCIGLAIWALLWSAISPVQAAAPVVRAVLFYSPSCPHCHKVITEDLTPLLEKYGDQLQIVGVDTTSQGGQVLFLSAIEHFNVPPERQAVPMLIIDDIILLGSLEIPEKFPGLVEAYLAQGGVDWPDIPGLTEALEMAQAQTTSTPELISTPVPAQSTALAQSTPALTETIAGETLAPEPTPTSLQSGLILTDNPSDSLRDRLARDLAGNALAILVLIGMLISVGGALALLLSPTNAMKPVAPPLAVPILCMVGFGIAGYLAYVETAQVTAVCGPVGDCNTVQQSEYARLFGVLPIGVLGLAGYAAILLAWLGSRFGSGRIASLASLTLLGMTLFGTLFSIYLTFLEPFVIGATCAWCLSSAVIMTILMWLSMIHGKRALTNLRYGETRAYTRRRIRSSIQSK